MLSNKASQGQFPPPTQSSGLVPESSKLATVGQGYWNGAGNPGLYNLVEVEKASCCIGPSSRVELGL